MKYILFINMIFLILANIFAINISKNYFSSFLSNSTNFNYNEIKQLVVFGDSLTDVQTNYTDMTYTGKNRSLGKNWSVYLANFHNATLWNYAVSGSFVDKKK